MVVIAKVQEWWGILALTLRGLKRVLFISAVCQVLVILSNDLVLPFVRSNISCDTPVDPSIEPGSPLWSGSELCGDRSYVLNQGQDIVGVATSVKLVTSTVTIPILASIADVYGRKPVVLYALWALTIAFIVFLLMSLLEGYTWVVYIASIIVGNSTVLQSLFNAITSDIIGDGNDKAQAFSFTVFNVVNTVCGALGGLIGIGIKRMFLENYGIVWVSLIGAVCVLAIGTFVVLPETALVIIGRRPSLYQGKASLSNGDMDESADDTAHAKVPSSHDGDYNSSTINVGNTQSSITLSSAGPSSKPRAINDDETVNEPGVKLKNAFSDTGTERILETVKSLDDSSFHAQFEINPDKVHPPTEGLSIKEKIMLLMHDMRETWNDPFLVWVACGLFFFHLAMAVTSVLASFSMSAFDFEQGDMELIFIYVSPVGALAVVGAGPLSVTLGGGERVLFILAIFVFLAQLAFFLSVMVWQGLFYVGMALVSVGIASPMVAAIIASSRYGSRRQARAQGTMSTAIVAALAIGIPLHSIWLYDSNNTTGTEGGLMFIAGMIFSFLSVCVYGYVGFMRERLLRVGEHVGVSMEDSNMDSHSQLDSSMKTYSLRDTSAKTSV